MTATCDCPDCDCTDRPIGPPISSRCVCCEVDCPHKHPKLYLDTGYLGRHRPE